jgi:hypothetical protein
MLFISVRSDTTTQVPKVLQVVEESKRKRHKLGRYFAYHHAPRSSTSRGSLRARALPVRRVRRAYARKGPARDQARRAEEHGQGCVRAPAEPDRAPKQDTHARAPAQRGCGRGSVEFRSAQSSAAVVCASDTTKGPEDQPCQSVSPRVWCLCDCSTIVQKFLRQAVKSPSLSRHNLPTLVCPHTKFTLTNPRRRHRS